VPLWHSRALGPHQPSADVERGLREQVLYYRRRAAEYDETSAGWEGVAGERFGRWLERLGPSGDALEIACGTGLWTRHLVGSVGTCESRKPKNAQS
jgi:hypothetical protein